MAAGQLTLDYVQCLVLMLHPGTQPLQLQHHLLGGTQSLFVKVELSRIVIELARFIVAAK